MPNWGFVWMVAWPDFRARLRRFLVIGVGMALVLAITLLLSAFSEGFQLRAERLVGVFGGDQYVVAAGSAGPMTSSVPLPATLVDEVAALPGVVDAAPLFLAPNAVLIDGSPAGVVVAGVTGSPRLVEGRGIDAPGEAIIDEELVELSIGETFVLGGRSLTVVGTTEHATWDFATAGIFLGRDTALELLAGGSDVATAIVVTGDVGTAELPAGTQVQSTQSAVDDVVSRTAKVKRAIDAFRVTLWVLAIVIVGAVLYLAALERIRDFAILKATGARNGDLVWGLALQAVMVGVVAGVMAIGLAHLLMPIYPGLLSLPFAIAWPAIPVAVVIAVLSSFVGVRRAIRTDPSQAFG